MALIGLLASSLLAVGSIANPGFEGDGVGVGSPTGWTSVGTESADFTEGGGHSGGFRLSHWSAEAFDVETRQTVGDRPDGWYTLRAWVRRSSGANESSVELDCGGRPERVHLPVAWPSEWLQVVVSDRSRHGSCSIGLRTAGAAGEWSNFDDIELVPGRARTPILGADVSSLHKSEDLGGVYLDDHPRDHCRPRHEDSALDILKRHGINRVRLRVWLDPADGYHDSAEIVAMGRRAKRAGLGLLVDLHYSDTWADPSHQTKPAAWVGLDVEQLRQAVYDHTFEVCSALREQGVTPAMVQIGNELNSGMLWPDGHTWNPPNWDNLAAFLKAGSEAVKACSPQTKVMLHLANGGDNGLYRWWFDNITARGVPFDVIGASYYGYWHGSLGALQYNLNDVAARYNKDVVVVETAYPFTLAGDDDTPNIIGLESQLVPGYPATPAGQARNLRDVLAIVRAVPNGRGCGVFYWDATWTAVPGNGWDPADPASGDAWENQALFDFNDRALPAMSVRR